MGEFLEKEKKRQAEFLKHSGYFSMANGVTISTPNRLPMAFASHNLNPYIRAEALDYFENQQICWPRGQQSHPSPDLCDIGVNLINFLFPFRSRPQALVDLFVQIYPGIKNMLPFEDGTYLTFFWQTEGSNLSADAAFLFQRNDLKQQLVLISWNYCESFPVDPVIVPEDMDTLTAADLPIKTERLESLDALFYQPFSRLLEVQILAKRLEKSHVSGADIVSVLHIQPLSNQDLLTVVSPALMKFGITPNQIWQNLVQPYDRFYSAFTENLFGHFDIAMHPDLLDWWLYITRRYPWLVRRVVAGSE